MEAVCYHAYWASTELAEERGRYSSYQGSLWDRGILPLDSLDLLAQAARRLRRSRPLGRPLRLGRAARADRAARHAQLELRGDRADGDHLEHHRRGRLDRAVLRQPVGQVEPVGRVHRRQRVPGARPEAPGPVGRRDGHGPEALRRFAAADRPRAAGPEGALRDRVRDRAAVAGRGRRAAPEVDRPGAVAQHLHGRRLGQEARRDLQARLAARPEDDLLPAHAGARRTPRSRPCNRAGSTRCRRARAARRERARSSRSGGARRCARRRPPTSSSARSTIPTCEACQ